MSAIRKISIFGYSQAKENDLVFRQAFAVCQALAKAGFVIINGGGPGVMRAASLGAKSGGGQVVGVTFYPVESEIYEGRDPANLIDKEVRTENYVERTLKLLALGDVYLVFKGGAGTISEFGMAWELGHLYFGHHKPVLLYGEFWYKIIDVLKKNMLLVPAELKVVKIVSDPTEILAELKRIEKEAAKVRHEHKKRGEAGFQL